MGYMYSAIQFRFWSLALTASEKNALNCLHQAY